MVPVTSLQAQAKLLPITIAPAAAIMANVLISFSPLLNEGRDKNAMQIEKFNITNNFTLGLNIVTFL
jgi:hypothetical protein